MDRRVGGGRRRKARGWRALDQARPAMLLVCPGPSGLHGTAGRTQSGPALRQHVQRDPPRGAGAAAGPGPALAAPFLGPGPAGAARPRDADARLGGAGGGPAAVARAARPGIRGAPWRADGAGGRAAGAAETRLDAAGAAGPRPLGRAASRAGCRACGAATRPGAGAGRARSRPGKGAGARGAAAAAAARIAGAASGSGPRPAGTAAAAFFRPAGASPQLNRPAIPRPEPHGPRTMTEEFHRIRRLPPYVFAEVNGAKAKARGGRRGHRRPRHGQPRHARRRRTSSPS